MTQDTEKTQHARFLETARALGCDEDEAAFDEKLKAVVGPKPEYEQPRTAPMDDDLPDAGLIAIELLLFLRLRRRPLKAAEVYLPLAEKMKIPTSQLHLKRNTTEESLWNNRVQTARNQLCDKGYMPRDPFNSWTLTEQGLQQAALIETYRTAPLEDFLDL